MDERRQHPRIEVDEPAYISVDGTSTSCRVVNISADGAAIEVHADAYVPDRFQLMTVSDRVVRDCRMVWLKGRRVGVQFEPPG